MRSLSAPFANLMLTLACVMPGGAEAAVEPPPHTVAEVRVQGAMRAQRGIASRHDPAGLQRRAISAAPARQAGVGAKSHSCCEVWVHDAWIGLYDDFDDDGFYRFLQLGFDVDTYQVQAELYADVYLQDSWGTYTHLYATPVFSVYGQSPDDAYEVEAELLSGFEPDYYAVRIELFDARDDQLVAVFDASNDADLSQLPLEGAEHDPPHPHGGSGDALVFDTHGGPLSPALLFGLAAAALRRAWRAQSRKRRVRSA